jgi:hypothetical protein
MGEKISPLCTRETEEYMCELMEIRCETGLEEGKHTHPYADNLAVRMIS